MEGRWESSLIMPCRRFGPSTSLSMRVWLKLWILWILSCMPEECHSWWTTALPLLTRAPTSGHLILIIFWLSRFDSTQLLYLTVFRNWKQAGYLMQTPVALEAGNRHWLEFASVKDILPLVALEKLNCKLFH